MYQRWFWHLICVFDLASHRNWLSFFVISAKFVPSKEKISNKNVFPIDRFVLPIEYQQRHIYLWGFLSWLCDVNINSLTAIYNAFYLHAFFLKDLFVSYHFIYREPSLSRIIFHVLLWKIPFRYFIHFCFFVLCNVWGHKTYFVLF